MDSIRSGSQNTVTSQSTGAALPKRWASSWKLFPHDGPLGLNSRSSCRDEHSDVGDGICLLLEHDLLDLACAVATADVLAEGASSWE